MKRMLVATALLTAIAASYSGGAVAQQTPNELGPHEPAAANDGLRSPHTQRVQPSAEDALVSKSRGSGLAPEPESSTLGIYIERVPRPVDAEDPSRLVGRFAVSRRGERIGEILAVVRSPTAGLLVVIEAGEYLGVGERSVAVSIEPGSTDRNGHVRLQASRVDLEKLPAFTADSIEQYREPVASNRKP